MLIDGKKFACEACIRGHRVTGCQHSDRALIAIAKKGRPVTQCQHCRTSRKNRNGHNKCECESKKKSKNGEVKGCQCNAGGQCTCSQKKKVLKREPGLGKPDGASSSSASPAESGPLLHPLPSSSSLQAAQLGQLPHFPSSSQISPMHMPTASGVFMDDAQYDFGNKRMKLTSARSETSLQFMNKHHKPSYSRHHGMHSVSPYTIPNAIPELSAARHARSEQSSPDRQARGSVSADSEFPLPTYDPATTLSIPVDGSTPPSTAGSFLQPGMIPASMGVSLASSSSTSLASMATTMPGMGSSRIASARLQPNLSVNTGHPFSYSYDNLYSAGAEQPQFSPGLVTPGWDGMPSMGQYLAAPNPMMYSSAETIMSPAEFVVPQMMGAQSFTPTVPLPKDAIADAFTECFDNGPAMNGMAAGTVSSNSSDLAEGETYGRSGASSMLDLHASYDNMNQLWSQTSLGSTSTLYQRMRDLSTSSFKNEEGVLPMEGYPNLGLNPDMELGNILEDPADGLWMASSSSSRQQTAAPVAASTFYRRGSTNTDIAF